MYPFRQRRNSVIPKENRLKQDRDFQKLFNNGLGVFDPVSGVKFKKNNLKITRFAFVVGLKTAKKAVARNLIKRRAREVVRNLIGSVVKGYDVAIIFQKKAVGMSKKDLETNITRVFKKAKLI